jgi:hypothetical protein
MPAVRCPGCFCGDLNALSAAQDVASLLIVNESQLVRGAVVPCPLVELEVTVRYQEVEQLERIEREVMGGSGIPWSVH